MDQHRAWIVVAAGLILAASMVPLMRPFRDYLDVMLTVLILTTVVDPLIRDAVFGDIAPGWHQSPVAAPVC